VRRDRQPDGGCTSGGQHCAQLWSGIGFDWDNNWCTSARRFVCEWE
jgi:hypothetical protein